MFVGAKFSAQGDKNFKEKPDVKRDKENSDLRTRPLKAKLPTVKRN